MSEASRIESVVQRSQELAPDDKFRFLGEAAIRIGRIDEGVLLGWISQLPVREFVEKLSVTPSMVQRLTISRPTIESPEINASRLLDLTPLSDEEAASIFIIRDDIDDKTTLAYELGYEGYAEIAAVASTGERALSVLEKFIPSEAAEEIRGSAF